MVERPLLVSGGPVTQSAAAVVELLNSLGRPTDPLPDIVDLGTTKLVRSSKGDAFYCVTQTACSCPSFTYRGGPCKHQKKYFAETKKHGQTLAETLEEHDRNLHKMPKSYQRMVRQAREQAEAETCDNEILAEPQNVVRCKQISEEERAAKIAAAKARCEANRQQAKAHQARQRDARQRADTSVLKPSIINYGAFKPVCPEEDQNSREHTILAGIIDIHDTTPGEVAYWERKQRQEV